MTNYENFNNSARSFRIYCDKITSNDTSNNLRLTSSNKNIELKVVDGKKIVFKNDVMFNNGLMDLNNKPLAGLVTISAESLNLLSILKKSTVNIVNKSRFSDTSDDGNNTFLTYTNTLQDLSKSFFNHIDIVNSSSVIVDLNVTLYCSNALNERITVELWRDASMLVQSKDLGSVIAAGGMPIPYNITYLDENLTEGTKKYYIKYKLENSTNSNNNYEHPGQGIINITSSDSIKPGYASIILTELTNNTNHSNKIIFDNSNLVTTLNEIQDLSALFYNTIDVFNSNVQVNINANLLCCYGINERLNIEVWRDASMIAQSNNLGTINTTDGLTIPYSFNYLDTNLSNGPKKYYLKYKLEQNSTQKQGIVNLSTLNSIGTSNILLRNVPKINDNLLINNNNNNNNTSFVTTSAEIQDLSGQLFNNIELDNTSAVIVDLNITLFCCYAANERITVQLWRDLSMVSENINIGNSIATSGLTINYKLSLLDESVSAGIVKYYLKYKLESNLSGRHQGIINVTGGYNIIEQSNIASNINTSYKVLSYTSMDYTNVAGYIKNTKIGYNPIIVGDKGSSSGRRDAYFSYIDVAGSNSHFNDSLYVKKNIVVGGHTSITSDLSVNGISLATMFDKLSIVEAYSSSIITEFSSNRIKARDLSASNITISNELYVLNKYYANDLNISGQILSAVLRVPHEFTIEPATGATTSSSNNWTPLGRPIYGETLGDRSGWYVSLNADGTKVAIGAPFNDGTDITNSNRGQIRVYKYNSADISWMPMGQSIYGDTPEDNAGRSISLNGDGNILAIGALGNNNYTGLVRVYKYTNDTSWVPIGQTIIGEASRVWSGWSVSLNALGTKVAVGSPFTNNGRGRVRIYQYNNTGTSDSSWVQMAGYIDGTTISDEAGKSVSLNAEGTIVAIDSSSYNGSRGLVRVFKYINSNTSDTSWVPVGQTIIGEALSSYFGNSISLNAYGNIIAIGAPYNNSRGRVRVYEYINDTSWVTMGIAIDGEKTGDENGYSVSLNADGNRFAIGARSNDGNDSTDTNRGRVRVYQYNNDANDPSWIPIGKDIDGEIGDYSGWSVSLDASGTRVAIGAPINNSSTGVVKVYEFQDVTSLVNSSLVVNGNLIVRGNKKTIKSSIIDISAFSIKIANNLRNRADLSNNPAGFDVSYIAALHYDGTMWNVSGGNLLVNNMSVGLDVSLIHLQTTISNSLIASKLKYDSSFALLKSNIDNSFANLYTISQLDNSYVTISYSNTKVSDLKNYIDLSFVTKQVFSISGQYIVQNYVTKAYVDASFSALNNRLDLSFVLKKNVELSYNDLSGQIISLFASAAASDVDISTITIETIKTPTLALTSHVLINGDLIVGGDTSCNSLNISNTFTFSNNGYSSIYRLSSNPDTIIEEYSSKFNNFGKFRKVLYILADGSLYYQTGTGAISDSRLKENIVDASPKLEDLLKVRIVDYNLKNNSHKKYIGVVAQELEQLFPSLVSEDFVNANAITKYKSVKYSCFNVMLIKALQEQQLIINDLALRLERLQEKKKQLKENA